MSADIEKKAILVVSFGTSYNETREVTIGEIERSISSAFPAHEVRRAFTSQMIIKKIKARDGEQIDNVEEAMHRLAADGFKKVIVQPTHVMNGYEYDKMMEQASRCEAQFCSVKYGRPLLDEEKDYERLIQILADETSEYNNKKTAIVFMGHGTEHEANAAYTKLDQRLKEAGYPNYYIGTVEAVPTLDDVRSEIKKGDYNRVILLPLMIVAGDHANNDMMGEGEDTWKSVFESEGYEVECILKGLGEYPGIQEMFTDHVKGAQ